MKKRGFAIIIVLFGLSVLTALLSISSTLTLASIKRNSVDELLAHRAADRFGLVEFAAANLPVEDPVTVLNIEGISLEVREVSGLVDLNSASRSLLVLFFENAGYSGQQLNVFLEWRAEGQRLLRLEDLGRIVGPAQEFEDDLFRLATVYSGKQGIAPEAVTDGLKGLMGWNNEIPTSFIAPLGNAVFNVYRFDSDSGRSTYLGTVSRSQERPSILFVR